MYWHVDFDMKKIKKTVVEEDTFELRARAECNRRAVSLDHWTAAGLSVG
jgi:hypothetical protein